MRAALALLALLLAAPAPAAARAAGKRCGIKALHGETLTLWVVDEPIRCATVRRIARGRCTDYRP